MSRSDVYAIPSNRQGDIGFLKRDSTWKIWTKSTHFCATHDREKRKRVIGRRDGFDSVRARVRTYVPRGRRIGRVSRVEQLRVNCTERRTSPSIAEGTNCVFRSGKRFSRSCVAQVGRVICPRSALGRVDPEGAWHS